MTECLTNCECNPFNLCRESVPVYPELTSPKSFKKSGQQGATEERAPSTPEQLFDTFIGKGPESQGALIILLKKAVEDDDSKLEEEQKPLVNELYKLKLEYAKEENRKPHKTFMWTGVRRKRNIEETNKIEKKVIEILEKKYGRNSPQTLWMLRF